MRAGAIPVLALYRRPTHLVDVITPIPHPKLLPCDAPPCLHVAGCPIAMT
jgi:hypothetical protein